jgi:hypothetical protein
MTHAKSTFLTLVVLAALGTTASASAQTVNDTFDGRFGVIAQTSGTSKVDKMMAAPVARSLERLDSAAPAKQAAHTTVASKQTTQVDFFARTPDSAQ